ncbi:MAG TPA: TetR/AcrR family transcriptional regulator [Clostridiales bacterium]|nr:TetR/AcrR family transcriptional regulator [Clostridiales bacterium]
MPKRIDRRVRKTKSQLRKGLTVLLQKKPIKDITVRELSDLVDINRGTFYLHYKDIYDMLSEIEEEMFRDVNQIINETPNPLAAGTPLPFLEKMFTYLSDNSDLCIALLGENGDIAFVDKLKSVVRTKCLYDWMSIHDNSNVVAFEYFYSFIVSGCIGLLSSWLSNGEKETPKQMATLAEQIILHGIAFFNKK